MPQWSKVKPVMGPAHKVRRYMSFAQGLSIPSKGRKGYERYEPKFAALLSSVHVVPDVCESVYYD